MAKTFPQRDPIEIYQRENVHTRMAGEVKQCACGESRLAALNTRTKPVMCEECRRKKRGQTTMDKHHPAGEANNPTTIRIPANDHKVLSFDQYDWQAETLKNPDGSPLLAAAACIRGFKDIILYLIDKLLMWIADMLGLANRCLIEKLGPKWWQATELKQFQSKGKRTRDKSNDK